MAGRAEILALMIHVLLLAAPPASSSKPRGFRATMMRREAAINFTQAALQASARLSMLAARLGAAAGGPSTQTPLRPDGGAYDMEFSIGTPPQKLTALADPGSDLVWAQCGSELGVERPGLRPCLRAHASSSFSKLPCSDSLCSVLCLSARGGCSDDGSECNYTSTTAPATMERQGTWGPRPSLSASDAVKGRRFRLQHHVEERRLRYGLRPRRARPRAAVPRLPAGRRRLLLLPQPPGSMGSPLLFGSLATLSGDGVQSTGFMESESDQTFYNVNLKSITVGSTMTSGTGTNGVVFDSGTTLLTDPAFTEAQNAILAQTTLPRVAGPDGFDTCFQLASDNVTVPSMVLHFDGADMELPAPRRTTSSRWRAACADRVQRSFSNTCPSSATSCKQTTTSGTRMITRFYPSSRPTATACNAY
ncbi:hypothetical protein EJB05_52707, partial [Eragrostis curvula]